MSEEYKDDDYGPDELLAIPEQRAEEDTLAQLHGLLAGAFIRRVRSSKATPSDLNAARQFLKDNNISCDGPRNPGMQTLADGLPDVLPDYPQ